MILNLEDDACNVNKKKDTNKSYKEAILKHNVTTSQGCVGNNVKNNKKDRIVSRSSK